MRWEYRRWVRWIGLRMRCHPKDFSDNSVADGSPLGSGAAAPAFAVSRPPFVSIRGQGYKGSSQGLYLKLL